MARTIRHMQMRLRFATFAGTAAWWTGVAVQVGPRPSTPVLAAAAALQAAFVAALAGLERIWATEIRTGR